MKGKFLKSLGAGLASIVLAGAVQAGEINCRFHQSPDYTPGRKSNIDMIVLHTTQGSGVGAENWLTTKDEVPAGVHYLIMEDGEIVQLVKEEDSAWHCRGYNSRSIGIEFAGDYRKLLNEAQIKVGRQLVKDLMGKYKISETNVKAHSELDPGRRTDPGKENMEAILSGIGTDIITNAPQTYPDFKYQNELPVILETAKRVGIEPELMLAIRMAENGGEGLQFGVMPTKKYEEAIGYTKDGKFVPYRNSLEKQASWCAWTIRRNIERYNQAGEKSDFIDYLQRSYSPNSNNWERNVRHYYSEFKSNPSKN